MADKKPVDGYWLNMGKIAVDSLGPTLRDDLTPRCREIIAEYLGGIMDMAYNMGIRLGRFQSELASKFETES